LAVYELPTISKCNVGTYFEKMTKHIKIFLFVMHYSACGQNATEMRHLKCTRISLQVCEKKFIEEIIIRIADEKCDQFYRENTENRRFKISKKNKIGLLKIFKCLKK
jgi:hypothetical protein